MTKSSNQEMNQLSKEALQTGLIDLLVEKELDAISVTELCERAGVSRMTYYRNYHSMTDLYHETLDVIFKEILVIGQEKLTMGDWPAFWLDLFTFCYKNKKMVRIILHTSQNTMLLDYLNQAFAYHSTNAHERYHILAFIGITYNLLLEWSRNDFDATPEEIATLCSQIIPSNFQAAVPSKYTT